MPAVQSVDGPGIVGRFGSGAPPLWVGAAVVAVILLSVLPDGLPFWPFVTACLIVIWAARPRRRGPGQGAARWSGGGSGWPLGDPAVRSPFETPAFWDVQPVPADHLRTGRPRTPGVRTPPAWDPLGAAPFAWDLPEPPPLRPPRAVQHPVGAAALATGAVLLTAALVTIGDVAGWWSG